MKKISAICCLLTTLVTAASEAQSTGQSQAHEKSKGVLGARYSFGSGYSAIDPGQLQALNNRMQHYNFAPMAADYGSWSLDLFHFVINDNVFHMGINGLFNRNSVNEYSLTSTSSLSFDLNYGRIILKGKHYLLYPSVGFELGNFSMSSQSGGNVSDQISGSCPIYAFDIALNFDYLFRGMGDRRDWASNSKNKDNSLHGTPVLSLTAGYRFSPFTSYWTDLNYGQENNPVLSTTTIYYVPGVIGATSPANLAMAYVSIKFGIGVFSR
jgi:hypothetical protein